MRRRPVPLARLDGLARPERGLSAAEARERLARHGPNDIVESPRDRWWHLARDTARDPMIWFLIGTGALYGLVGERAEALTLMAAIVPLVGMDAILHRRTQASTAGLQSRLASRATVVRDGTPTVIAASEVVPGDLALVGAGEPFPADGLVVAGEGVQVDEATLTGEAYPVRKYPLAVLPSGRQEALVESRHWGLAGTRVLTGRASLRIVHTGSETLYGEIVRSAVSGPRGPTPLQQSIEHLVTALVAAAGILCLILAFVRLQQGYGWVDALVSALTLAVAALPEEFPVVFTFFLGVGVYRLARHQALVRRAVSVENIGRVSAICCDKTGTMTEGRLRLTHLVPADDVVPDRLLALALIAARGETGDPIDRAIADAAKERGRLSEPPPSLATFPFTEDRKRETAIVRDGDGSLLAVTKGAVELVLDMSTLDDTERGAWSERTNLLAGEGHKVIACAWRLLDAAAWAGGEPDHGFRLAGVLAFEDPLRPGIVEALATCRDAGIRVIMVTGDHPLTGAAVAREIGLGDGAPVVVSGDELERRLAADGHELGPLDVVARAVPLQKLALVRALQASGEIVAVTGDGVNDVPALQAADVGIAMGERGTRSAREIAAIVLLDDNFRTIVGAIGEGRQLFLNLQLSFQYLLMIHLPLVVTAALVPLAGYPLLYLPIHIVWLEMIIHPSALLAFQDAPSPGTLRRRAAPRRTERFFSRAQWTAIILVGGLTTSLVLWGYRSSLGEHGDVGHGRAMALMSLTSASAFITAGLSGLRGWTTRLIAGGTLASSLLLIETPALATRLHVTPLHPSDLALTIAGSFLACLPALLSSRWVPRSSLFRLRSAVDSRER